MFTLSLMLKLCDLGVRKIFFYYCGEENYPKIEELQSFFRSRLFWLSLIRICLETKNTKIIKIHILWKARSILSNNPSQASSIKIRYKIYTICFTSFRCRQLQSQPYLNTLTEETKKEGGYAAPALSYSRHMYRINRSVIGAIRQRPIMKPRTGITLRIIKISWVMIAKIIRIISAMM